MVVALVQDETGFMPGGNLTGDVDLVNVATLNNLLLYVIAGDKDVGTADIDGNPGAFQLPINLRASDVSLVFGVKVSDGTEQTIDCEITSGNGGGSNLWCGEFGDDASTGIWRQLGIATNNSDGSNQTVWSSGTTGAATGDALAIATFTVDSVNTVPTPTYTNGFTALITPVSGGNEAAMWLAYAYISAGQTAETELDRGVGATPDQMSGAMYLFGRSPHVPPQVFGSYGSFF